MSLLDITSGNFTNFEGIYQVSVNRSTEERFLQHINIYEKKYLQDLLGCDLYTLFEADLDAADPQVPQSAIYLSIYNEFCYDDSLCGLRRSYSMVDMLTAFIYFEWLRNQKFKPTGSGVVVSDSENSNQASFDGYGLYSTYNRGVESFKAIQWFICDNSTDYPDYNGINKDKTSYL